jgi:hypothetical protein
LEKSVLARSAGHLQPARTDYTLDGELSHGSHWKKKKGRSSGAKKHPAGDEIRLYGCD